MPRCLDPRLDALPAAQQELWPALRPAADLGLVLYGGTAVALHLGHRQSVDFDFFGAEPLDKEAVRGGFAFGRSARILQDRPETLVVSAATTFGPVKVSFFGGPGIGRSETPLQTRDGVLLVASMRDLLATKLKATLDRAEAKDYVDIARLLDAGESLPLGLAIFRRMFRGEPAEALRALGYFGDGDLASVSVPDRAVLAAARDAVRALPEAPWFPGTLAIPRGCCDDA